MHLNELSIISKDDAKLVKDDLKAKINIHGEDIFFALCSIKESEFTAMENKVGPFDILVKKIAFSTNYRDIALILHFSSLIKQKSQRFPFGSDFVAEVIKGGEGNLKSGDIVIPNANMGKSNSYKKGIPTNYASKILDIFHSDQLLKIPKSMPIETAASFTVAAQTSYSMVRRSLVKKGDNVLIMSGGSNTSLAIIEALKFNHEINLFISTTTPEVSQLLKEKYNARVFLFERNMPFILNKDFRSVVKTQKFDIVFDPFLDIHFAQIQDYIEDYGKYITCGTLRQHEKMKFDTSIDSIKFRKIIVQLMLRNISIIGNCLGTTDDLLDALNDNEMGRFELYLDSVIDNGDVNRFVLNSFQNKNKIGKVVYKY